MKKTLLIIVALLLFLPNLGLNQSLIAFAADDDPVISIPTIPQPTYQPGPSQTNLPDEDVAARSAQVQDKLLLTIARFLEGFIGAMAALAVLMLIISGIQMLVAFGEEEKLTNAKKTATYAILGLVLAIFSFAIVRIISTLPLD